MTPPPDSSPTPAAPPPGCPAHGQYARLHGPEATADPKGFYERLREEHGAVAPVRLPGDLPAWLVLGHREILEVVRTPSMFSRDSRRWSLARDGTVGSDHPLAPLTAWQPVCAFADGEEHKRLRSAVTQSMDRVDRHGMRRYVTRFTGRLVDGFAETGRADLVSQFATHLPMLVMTRLIGLPEKRGPELVAAARDLVDGTHTAAQSNEAIVSLLRELVGHKRQFPGQDVASWLIEHEAGLNDQEVVEHLRFLLVAANETTTNLIVSTLRMVFTDSRLRANLAGASMTLPDTLEQVLWDAPPMPVVPGRWATGDTRLAGQEIKAGDMLLLGVAAGNMDPSVRPDLDVPLQRNRSHLAFSGGPHECPGQDIGRGIAETGIDALLAQLPDLQLAVDDADLDWNTSWLSSHVMSLPVKFTPRRAPAPLPAQDTSPAVQELPQQLPQQHASVPPMPSEGAPTRSSRWWQRGARRGQGAGSR